MGNGGGNGGSREASGQAGTPSTASDHLDQVCAALYERVRALAVRAQSVATSLPSGAAADAARALETEAGALVSLSEELLRIRGVAPRGGRTTPAEMPPLESLDARPRLLFAEDDGDDRDAVTAALEGDYEVSSVSSGRHALDAAREFPPDIALLDLYLPGLGGMEVLAAMRSDPRTSEVPVILLSGQADDATRVRALDLGAADFVQKPVSLTELRARIDRTLRLSKRHTHLRELAQTDTLTGLPNLRAFRARLEEEVQRAERYGNPLSCIMADMDNLKPVNDALGHAAGDRAIATVAEVIREQLRSTDMGARYGGDEFVLLLPHTTAPEGRVLAERIAAHLARVRLELGSRLVPLRLSFGVAELVHPRAPDAGTDLVRRADEALYAAKGAGRGRVEIYGVRAGAAPAGGASSADSPPA